VGARPTAGDVGAGRVDGRTGWPARDGLDLEWADLERNVVVRWGWALVEPPPPPPPDPEDPVDRLTSARAQRRLGAISSASISVTQTVWFSRFS